MESRNISSIPLSQPLEDQSVTWLQQQTAGCLVKVCPEIVASLFKKTLGFKRTNLVTDNGIFYKD